MLSRSFVRETGSWEKHDDFVENTVGWPSQDVNESAPPADTPADAVAIATPHVQPPLAGRANDAPPRHSPTYFCGWDPRSADHSKKNDV